MNAATGDPQHEPEHNRFVVVTGDLVALLAYRPLDATTLDYYHTYVPPELRGRGIASRLAKFALEHARAERLRVVPTCPFIADYVKAIGDTARKVGVEASGYRLLSNCGADANQEVPHLHVHIFGGRRLGRMLKKDGE